MPDEAPTRPLFTVEDAFTIRGRGVILVPGIAPRPGERPRVGDPVVLHRPDGSRLEAEIGGLELLHTSPDRPEIPILIRGLSRADVPIGTQVRPIAPRPPRRPDC